ncbi:hypothetical protein ACG98G_05740 [Megasphaera hexanoica]|uniref:Uncharacterized protein n=1 Tax=Megasphaera hexanoica TaxID=1675036 RepID=A0ABW7DPJ5_9FIRM|nr:hypothetical protein [Megasphaera hexanoica]AXB82764.1 hypothetical protein ACT01_11260 [Megasphaera hexanoica]
MSKWTEVRDGLVDALNVDEVTEAAKNQIVSSMTTEGMDAIEAVADKFVAQIQEQASLETGWNAIRDKFVLPLLINGGIWLVKLVLSKSTTSDNK